MSQIKLNNEDYSAKLAMLRDLEPTNDLLAKLERGNSALNSIYLCNALRIALAKKKAETPSVQSEPEKKKPASSLEINLRHLRASRAELSNSFIHCQTDDQRAAISDSILSLNVRIREIVDLIEKNKENPKLPELLPVNDKYPVPDDPLEMYKKNHSLRTNILRMQKDIERLKLSGAAERVLGIRETKLKELTIYKAYVQRAIDQYKAISSGQSPEENAT